MAKTLKGNIQDTIEEESMFKDLEEETEKNTIPVTEEVVEEAPKKAKRSVKTKAAKEEAKKTTRKVPNIVERDANGVPFISEKSGTIAMMKEEFNRVSQNIVVDLNNIVINDDMTEIERYNNIDIIFNSRPAFQVPLSQSGYQAFIESLRLDEISGLKNSTLDTYNYRLKLYQTIHQKLQTTSIGKINFKDFINMTSLFDLNTLYYGLYMQTFPGKSNFTFTCGHCGESFSADIPNDTLVSTKDEKMFERINEISLKSNKKEEVIENSLVTKTTRILLDESKTIVDIHLPSLANHLDGLHSVPADQVSEKQDLIYDSIFIKSIHLLNVPATLKTGKAQYFAAKTDFNSLFNVIHKLSLSDAKQLGNAISDLTDKYKIDYSIKSFKCPKCGKDMGDIDVDMEDMLFQILFRQ